MKSIMEEASSILKAIEKGWTKAGQPKEFSVKIFEEAQKNFFGMTVKPAKIALFFNDTAVETTKSRHASNAHKATASNQENKQKEKAPRKEPKVHAPKPEARLTKEVTPFDFQEQSETPMTPQVTNQPATPVWSDVMVEDAQNWLREILALTDLEQTTFHNQVQHFHLRIQFPKPIFEDQMRQKQLFSGLATILLQMLKQKYRRPLKGYKIILTTD